MATPTTVLEFAQNTFDANTTAKADAQTALNAAQTELKAARQTLEAATAALQEKEKEITAKRVEVAAADTPAEGEALMAELIALVAEQRALQGGVIDGRDGAARAAQESELRGSVLARVSARLSRAQAELGVATAEGAKRDALKATATAAPLDTLAADAGAALGGPDFTTAEGRITDAIPAQLLAAARKGHELETAQLARLKQAERTAEDLLLAELEANGGAAGLVARRRLELDRAERDLREWSEGAVTRFNRALSLLQEVNAEPDILSAAELAGVQALDAAPGQDAATLRVALLDARIAVHDAELALEEATAAALAPDPGADVSGVTEVVDAQAALDAANATLGTAQTDFDAVAADFTAWTAEVPDHAWRRVLAFIEADTLLQQLSGTDTAAVTALVDAVVAAEADLAAALDAAERHAVSAAFLEDFVARRAARTAVARASHSAHLLSEVRGDL